MARGDAGHDEPFDAFERSTQFRLELFRAYTEYTKIVLTSLFFMNGGAAVALLAYLGNRGMTDVPHHAKLALIAYVIGVACAVLAGSCAMLTEFVRHHAGAWLRPSSSIMFGAGALGLVVISLLSFILGCLTAAQIFH